jgi:hypothetical protein
MQLDLNPRPDGMGWIYGMLYDDNGNSYRVNIMPPQGEWNGHFPPGPEYTPHATDWVVYIDGEEIARVAKRDDITAPALLAHVMS